MFRILVLQGCFNGVSRFKEDSMNHIRLKMWLLKNPLNCWFESHKETFNQHFWTIKVLLKNFNCFLFKKRPWLNFFPKVDFLVGFVFFCSEQSLSLSLSFSLLISFSLSRSLSRSHSHYLSLSFLYRHCCLNLTAPISKMSFEINSSPRPIWK